MDGGGRKEDVVTQLRVFGYLSEETQEESTVYLLKAEQRNSCLFAYVLGCRYPSAEQQCRPWLSPHRARKVQFTRQRVVASVHSRCSHTFAIISAPASPMATLVALVLAPMISGIAEASQTRRAVAPRTWEEKAG